MSNSPNLALPLLEAAQAQKHVTVNDALQTIDALIHMGVESAGLSAPPSSPLEGNRWFVPPSATGAWAGHDNEIAAWTDGVWIFHVPMAGWYLWLKDLRKWAIYDGAKWVGGPAESIVALSDMGASTRLTVTEISHTLVAGPYNDTSLTIPAHAIVFGVTARVISAVTGPTSWTIGIAADVQRYANSAGTALGSIVNGVSSTPTAYYNATPVRVSATGGDFTGGQIRLALHYLILGVPSA